MVTVQSCEIPESAFLSRYARGGAYADCYLAELERAVSQPEFVEAFYTTFVFRLERFVLKWLAGRPSSDADAKDLALGASTSFAAWRVEERNPNQLLLADFTGRTRSWLMALPGERHSGDARTRLYFGSAVVPRLNASTGKKELGTTFRVLLGFHKMYSRVLLRAASARLRSQRGANAA